jgi:hypothetical protein
MTGMDMLLEEPVDTTAGDGTITDTGVIDFNTEGGVARKPGELQRRLKSSPRARASSACGC